MRVGVVTESAILTVGPGAGSSAAGRARPADGGMSLPAMTAPGMATPGSLVPQHCGTPMEWRKPEPVAMASYSFEPAGRDSILPALWRCRCGFQLDDVGTEAPGFTASYRHSR